MALAQLALLLVMSQRLVTCVCITSFECSAFRSAHVPPRLMAPRLPPPPNQGRTLTLTAEPLLAPGSAGTVVALAEARVLGLVWRFPCETILYWKPFCLAIQNPLLTQSIS